MGERAMATAYRIGRYEILQHLATGGMGRVYLARATGPGGFARHVVVKTLDISAPAPTIAMFLEEARVMSGLHHHHIAPVFEVGRDDDGRYFLVMDYVHGQTAQAVIQRTLEIGAMLPVDFALSVTSAAAAALHYMHDRRGADNQSLHIIHRDATLSNLMVGYDGAVKLIDFGIARADDRSSRSRTEHGFVKGKVGYLAPEQVLGKPIDHRADIFTLGVVLYELTTMTRAFKEVSDIATLDKIAKGQLAKPSTIVQNYPRGLEAIVMKALAVDPGGRFQTAAEMRDAIEDFGRQHKLWLGEAAIVEVMVQLFEDRQEPWRHVREFSDNEQTVAAKPSIVVPASQRTSKRLRAASDVANVARPQTLQPFDDSEEDTTMPTAPEVIDDTILDQPARPLYATEPGVAQPSKPEAKASKPEAKASKPEAKASKPEAKASKPEAKASKPEAKAPNPEPKASKSAPASSAKGSRLGPVVFLGVLVAGGAGIAYAIATQSSPEPVHVTPPPIRPDPPPVTVTADAAAPVALAPDAAIAPVEPPAPTPDAGAAAMPTTTIRVRITSTPSDATILLDGQRLGHTPFDGRVPTASGTHALRLRKRGYLTSAIDIPLTADLTREVTLEVSRE
jgi:serine/threonine-protein kinase